MPPSRQKRPFNVVPVLSMMIDDVWKSGSENVNKVEPPKPNQYGTVPFSRLVYHLDNLNDLYRAIVVDQDVAGYIQKKSPILSERNCRRELIELTLMGFKDVFRFRLWIIPLFQDGVLCSQLYATDDENQQLMLTHRNPTITGHNEYTLL
jgi:hypothetical protein